MALLLTEGRVEHQVDLVILDGVNDVRPALVDLVDPFALDPVGSQDSPGAIGGDQVISKAHKRPCLGHHAPLVGLFEGHQNRALVRQAHARRLVGLEERRTKIRVNTHDLAGGPHLGTEQHVRAGELVEGEDRYLD